MPVNSSQTKKRGNAKLNENTSDFYGTITKQENTVYESFPSMYTIAKDHRLKFVVDNISSCCPSQRRWVHGIDFSGAKDAGHKIWIAMGFIEEGVLHIKECRRAETLLMPWKGMCLSSSTKGECGQQNTLDYAICCG